MNYTAPDLPLARKHTDGGSLSEGSAGSPEEFPLPAQAYSNIPSAAPRAGPHQLEVKHAVLGLLQKRHELGSEEPQALLVPAWGARGRRRLWPGLRHRARPPAASPQPGQARPAPPPLPLPFLTAQPPAPASQLPLPFRSLLGNVEQFLSAGTAAELWGHQQTFNRRKGRNQPRWRKSVAAQAIEKGKPPKPAEETALPDEPNVFPQFLLL